MSRPVARDPRRRHAGHGPLHIEPFTHEHVREVPLRLELLEAELAVAEDLVHELLREDCLLYTSDAADERSSVDLGGRRIIKKTQSSTDKRC
mgnify:CR=1 FL=1